MYICMYNGLLGYIIMTSCNSWAIGIQLIYIYICMYIHVYTLRTKIHLESKHEIQKELISQPSLTFVRIKLISFALCEVQSALPLPLH